MRSLGLKSEGAQRGTKFKEPGSGLLAWNRASDISATQVGVSASVGPPVVVGL
jgi:hypothetical protein